MSKQTKRGPGRPKIAPEVRRTEVLSVRLTSEEMAFVESRADQDDKTPSSWAADVLAQACGLMQGPHASYTRRRKVSANDLRMPKPNPLEEEGEDALVKDLLRED